MQKSVKLSFKFILNFSNLNLGGALGSLDICRAYIRHFFDGFGLLEASSFILIINFLILDGACLEFGHFSILYWTLLYIFWTVDYESFYFDQ